MKMPVKSFLVDHRRLHPGLFVSRIDDVGGEFVTTFDLRLVRPLSEEELLSKDMSRMPSMKGLHSCEHLGAYFLRGSEKWSDKLIYWGPMGCKTGFYILLKGKYEEVTPEIIEMVKDVVDFIIDYDGRGFEDSVETIPGATAKECGNSLFQSLKDAKLVMRAYRNTLDNLEHQNLVYPE